MRVVFHPQFYNDASAISKHYSDVADADLAAKFRSELDRRIDEVIVRPLSFAVRESGSHRVNLRRFPYHFLFRVVGSDVRMLVVRHNRRRPSYGKERH